MQIPTPRKIRRPLGDNVNDTRACLLGCRTPDGYPFRAAPGSNVCAVCSTKLRTVVDDLQKAYADLDQLARLIPSGQPGESSRHVPGPKSPAVDAILVHLDPRSRDDTAALAVVEAWARWVREERSIDVAPQQMLSTVPRGRITILREVETLRFNWDWLMARDEVADFAQAMRAVLNAMRAIRSEFPKTVRIGKCPTVVAQLELPDGSTVDLDCGATLRVKVGDTEIRCRNCGTTWIRDQWHELGDPWTDYGYLANELDVNPATLRWWCKEDGWRTVRIGRRTVISRADALASYTRRRPGTYTIDQAG